MSKAKIDQVLSKVLNYINPLGSERDMLLKVANDIILRADLKCKEIGIDAEVRLVGSAAKDTWIRGHAEADVFVMFKQDLSKQNFESTVLDIGRASISLAGGTHRLRYAEHPYVEGFVNGIRINVVGCYKVKRGEWKTPVDRTPYHTDYVNSRLREDQKKDVRLLKSFLMNIGCYGAEIRVSGFSGYLCELLTIEYGSFAELVNSVARWRPPVIIDVEKHYEKREDAIRRFGKAHLIVVDPIDKKRNVAAAVSEEKFAEVILASKLFLQKPSLSFFRKIEAKKKNLKEEVSKGRNFLGILIKVKEEPPDVVWGEVKHTLLGIKKALERKGFEVIQSKPFVSNDKCLMLFELRSLYLPKVYKHEGPPVYLNNVVDFINKHSSSEYTLAGPWVEGNRIYVVKAKKEDHVDKVLKDMISKGEISISKGVKEGLINSSIAINEGIEDLVKNDDELRGFSEEFLSNISPSVVSWLRGSKE